MNINNHYANIEIISNGYGQPCIDKIGYDGYSTDIPIPRTFFISAHAPSKLRMNFKNSGKYYINGMLNKSSGIPNNSIIYRVYEENNKILLETRTSLIYHPIYFENNKNYIFDIICENNYGAHTIWNFYKAEENLTDTEREALQIAQKKTLDASSDYSLFIQTCNPRKKMALRCIISLLNNISILPKRIILTSIDNINDGAIDFPSCIEFWTGYEFLNNILSKYKISSEGINHIFNGFKTGGNPNMWLKYVIPRLCLQNENQVLITDDDVAFLGRCEELMKSKSYITFMEDSNAFYGQRTIDYYNEIYKNNKFTRTKPFVCAGMYKLNKKGITYSSEFINDLILRSESDPDEQSAVGMEIVQNPDYTTLKQPKYHHGGFENQNINLDELELMHMQGRAVSWRNNIDFVNKYIMPKKYDTK